MPCQQAFIRSDSLDACRESVKGYHPSCGHTVRLSCKQASELVEQNIPIPNASSDYIEGQIPPRKFVAGIPSCKEPVQLRRKCGHVETIQCSEVHKPLQGCTMEMSIRSPVCGHSINVACSLTSDLSSPFWPSDVFSDIIQNNKIPGFAKPSRDIGTFGAECREVIQSCQQSVGAILACGHEKEMKCSDLLSWLEGSASTPVRCEAVVSEELKCGHKINSACHDVKKSHERQCLASKLIKCWNFDVCQNELQVPCGFLGVPACTGYSTWTCPAGKHVRNIKQCSSGVPQECFWCSLDQLAAKISQPAPFCEEQDLRRILRVPDECLTWIEAPVSDFIARERELFMRCRSQMERITNVNTQYLLRSLRVPCFRSLTTANGILQKFEPKKFMNGPKSFHGIISRHLTNHNLKLMASKDQNFTLLVGYAATVHTKVLAHPPPTKNRDKTALARRLSGDGYDSMSCTDENGFQNLVIWEPFPMIALCRLTLTRAQLEMLAAELDNLQVPHLEPNPVNMKPPAHNCTLFSPVRPTGVNESASSDEDDDDEDDSFDGQLEREAANHLKGTEFEGMSLHVNWAGGLDLGDHIPQSVEKNLKNKMKFMNPEAPAFDGLRVIRTLMAKGNMESLYLVKAVESLPHSSKEARESLGKYRQFVQSGPPDARLHPWALIVAARLVENDVVAKTKLLSVYKHFFPLQQHFLEKDELDLLKGLDTSGPIPLDVHSILLQQWNDLKAAYPGEVNSVATEELLRLIGLRKVKEEVIRLWKSALQLKRMNEEARKENQLTANYCFVGNPGTGTPRLDIFAWLFL